MGLPAPLKRCLRTAALRSGAKGDGAPNSPCEERTSPKGTARASGAGGGGPGITCSIASMAPWPSSQESLNHSSPLHSRESWSWVWCMPGKRNQGLRLPGRHRRRGDRFGEQHPEVVAAAAAGIKQQGVVAPLPEGPPPRQGAGQVAACPRVGADGIEVMVVGVDAQPAAGALLALGMEADQLGSVQAAAGEMAPYQRPVDPPGFDPRAGAGVGTGGLY